MTNPSGRSARRRHPAVVAVTLASAVALLLVASTAAAKVELGGFTKAYTFVGLSDPWSLERTGARLQLETRGAAGPAAFYAAMDFDVDGRRIARGSGERGAELDIYTVEAYVTLSAGPLDLRFGRQLIFWGQTLWSPPADLLCPWDYSNMSAEIEDYRVARTGARGLLYVGDLTAELVWLPLFEGDRGVGGPTTMAGVPVTTVDQRPPPEISESELGLRVGSTIAGLDWAATALRVRDRGPVQRLAPILRDGGPPGPVGFTRTLSYPPVWAGGLDLARGLGPLLFKLEGAYYHRPEADADDPEERPSSARGVVALSYQHSEDLSVELQGQYERLLGYDRADTQKGLDELYPHGGVPPAPRIDDLEAALMVRFKLGPALSGQLMALGDLRDHDVFALAFVGYELASGVRAYLGTVAFMGPDDTTYGRLQEQSQAFAELKYSF